MRTGLVADDLAHRLLDALLGDVQRADAVPLLGMRGEIAGGVLGARVTHLGESRAIAGEKRVVSLEPTDDGAREGARRAGRRQTEEGPGPFAAALDEAGLDEELEMARDARLRLAQDRHDLAHRQLRLGEQRQKTQARLLSGGVQRRERRVEGQFGDGLHERSVRHKDIYIRQIYLAQPWSPFFDDGMLLTESQTGFIFSLHRTCRSDSMIGRLARAGPRRERDPG